MNERILFADDNLVERKILSKILEKGNYEVLLAENGNQAFELIQKEKLDLVILDIEMPGLNGLEVCKKIKAIDSLKDLPVIFVTGSKEKMYEAFELGGIDFIHKPFSKDEVFVRVGAQIEYRKLLEEKNQLMQMWHNSLNERMIGQVSVGLAHNFNNLLSSAMGYCQLIEMTSKEDDTLGRADTIQKILNDILHIVVNLRSFSDRSEVHKVEVDIISELDQILNSIKDETYTEFELVIENKLEAKVLVDISRSDFETCLKNIFQNAHEALSEEKKATLQIKIENKNLPDSIVKRDLVVSNTSFIMVSFHDNGKGFDESIDPYECFAPFSTIKKNVGVGLGLSVVKGFMKRHDGYTNAYNHDEGGACIELYFPISSSK